MSNIVKQDVIIVNEKDEVIGYKKRGTIKQDDIYRVSALLIKNSEGKYLLAQRSFKKKNNPGEWSFSVAGTIERYEDYDSNIRKEVEEEIGIYDLKYQESFKKRIRGKHNFFCQFYVAILDKSIEEFKIQEDELESIRWFSEDEILQGEYEGHPISETLLNLYNKF